MTDGEAALARPSVSVVVPTCGRPALLQRCIDALLAQTLDARHWELIVVDDAHRDDTASQVERIGRQSGLETQLRYLRPESGRGPAVARNCGWRAARGEVVAFTDDDTVPDADWLRQGMLAMGDGKAAVRGRVSVPVPAVLTDHGRMTQGLESAQFVTANCFVRRDALEEVGGFDERFARAWREDSDLHFKLVDRYGEVPKAPQAEVQHPVRDAPWGISLRQQSNVMFDALLLKKHPQLYQRRCGPRHAPVHYYAIVLASFGASLAALADRPRLAIGCGALAIALVARFAARRLRGTAHSPSHVAEMVLTSFAIPFLSLYWRMAGALRYRVRFF